MYKIPKVKLNFSVIDEYNTQLLSVVDLSQWGGIREKPAIIEITLPAYEQPSVDNLEKNGVNVFDSFRLGLKCGTCPDEIVDLPDGIYKITIKGSPDKYQLTKHHLRTAKFDSKVDHLLIKHVEHCDEVNEEFLETMNKIDVIKRAAEANVRNDNICKAHDLFEKALKMIEKVEKGKCK